MKAFNARLIGPLAFGAGLAAIIGCAGIGSDGTSASPAQRALIGKTKQQILACAGIPVHEYADGDRVLLVYYKEASQLEESFFGSKSSIARIHHGCRSTIVLQQDRAAEVRYESDPSTYQDEDHCEETFELCVHP